MVTSLLQRIETPNTKYVDFNNKQTININTKNGSDHKSVNDFRYPGALTESTTKHIKFRKAAVWRAGNELTGIWKSTLRGKLSERLFISLVGSLLRCECENLIIK